MSNFGNFNDFDKRFNRTQRFIKVWFVFVAVLALTIMGGIGYAIYSVATDPGQIGEAVGEVVKGYNETVK